MSQRTKNEQAPVGTFSGAYLVTDYFSIENRLKAPIRWRIRQPRTAAMARLRRRLAEAQQAFGLSVSGPTDLPRRRCSGQPWRLQATLAQAEVQWLIGPDEAV